MRLYLVLLVVLFARAQGGLVPLWQLGFEDYSVSDFGIESYGFNPSPGSAAGRDDDYYFLGHYPGTQGTVLQDEPPANFERLVASYDPTKRIHFPLTGDQAAGTTRFR